MLDPTTAILQTGAVGGMLMLVWNWARSKDRKSYEMIESQNKERRDLYESMHELVKEVTTALTYKNVTDDKMSAAIEKLADKIGELRDKIEENQR